MYTITTTADYVNIVGSTGETGIMKPRIVGLSTDHRTNKLTILTESKDSSFIIDFDEGTVLLNGATMTSEQLLKTTLLAEINIGQLEVFIATPGQTTFSPTFTCNTRTRVYVNGVRVISGFSIVAGDIVFGVAMGGGEEVILENI